MKIVEEILRERMRIGLDIGSYSVKFVQLRETKEGYSLVKLGYKRIFEDLAKSSDSDIRGERTAWVLASLWEDGKIGTRSVRLAVSDPNIYLRRVTVPKLPEEELLRAVKWQVEKYVPFSIEEAAVDFQTLGIDLRGDLNQEQIIVVAARKETINNYIGLLGLAKLAPIVLDVSPFAVAKAFLKNYSFNQGEPLAIIDIGSRLTSVIVVKDNSLQLVRNIEIGGNDFTSAISKGLNVNLNEAEEIKRGRSKDISHLIAGTLEDLAKELERSLSYCETELFIQGIAKVVICGGGARLQGLEGLLADKLGLKVELGNPFKNIAIEPSLSGAVELKEEAHVFMAALGAAVP